MSADACSLVMIYRVILALEYCNLGGFQILVYFCIMYFKKLIQINCNAIEYGL